MTRDEVLSGGCPSCGSGSLAPILHWPSIPVNAALFPASREESLAIPRGSFRLLACETCGLLFNADHDEDLAEYSARCIETPAHSPHHRAFTDALAREWIAGYGLAGKRVVEVGCGHDAAFLQQLLALGVGHGTCIDPACSVGVTGGLDVRRERLAPAHAEIPGAALVCRHTLEHIPRVRRFLDDVRAWATANGDAVVLFEVPDAGRILDRCAFWDMYYEHCSYFTATTLRSAFLAAGFRLERLDAVYDDQYLVAEARPGRRIAPDPATASSVVDAARDFARRAAERIRTASSSLRALHEDGPVVLWQAGGKALSLVTLTGTEPLVPGIVDVNPGKRGLYLPGTGIPILAPDDLERVRPRHVVVMNDVYLEEIAEMLKPIRVEASVRSVEALF